MTLQLQARDSKTRQSRWFDLDIIAGRVAVLIEAGATAATATAKKAGKTGSAAAAAALAAAESIRGIKQALQVPGSVLVVEAGRSVRALPPAPGCVVGFDADGRPATFPIGSLSAGATGATGAARVADALAASPIVWWLPPGGAARRPAMLLPDRAIGDRALRSGEVLLLVLLDSPSLLREGFDDAGRRQAGGVRTTISRPGRGVGEFLRCEVAPGPARLGESDR